MLKTNTFQVRREGLSRTAYLEHWRDIHVPIVREIAGVRGYVFNKLLTASTLQDWNALQAPEMDGLAQLWFDDAEARSAAFDTQAAHRMAADGPKYIGAGMRLFTSEHCLQTWPASCGPRAKGILLVERDARSDATGWTPALIAALPQAWPLGLTLNVVIDEDGGLPIGGIGLGAIHGLIEFGVDDLTTVAEKGAGLMRSIASLVAAAHCIPARETVILTPPTPILVKGR